MSKENIEVVFNPKKSHKESIPEEIIRGVLELREISSDFYLDNSTFALLIDSTEKKVPISVIKKYTKSPPIILNFEKERE